MSSEMPFKSRLSRQVATSLGMWRGCSNRACRRSGRCQGSVAESGKPRCVITLPESDQSFFTLHFVFALRHVDFLNLGRIELERGENTFMDAVALSIALSACADYPTARPALRRILRHAAIKPWAERPRRGDRRRYHRFGREADPDTGTPCTGDPSTGGPCAGATCPGDTATDQPA